MPTTVCIVCGKPTLNGTRCVDCNRGFRRTRHNPIYDDPAWKRLSRNEIAAHVKRYGWWCPGFGVPAHESRDLTLDHKIPGTLAGGTQVLCRGCNTRRSHEHSPRRRL